MEVYLYLVLPTLHGGPSGRDHSTIALQSEDFGIESWQYQLINFSTSLHLTAGKFEN